MVDIHEIPVADPAHLLLIKEQLLEHAQHSGNCSFLDSCGYAGTMGRYAWLCGWGSLATLSCEEALHPQVLAAFEQQHAGYWIFGHMGFEALHASILHASRPGQPDTSGFARAAFFVPEIVVYQPAGAQHIVVSGQGAAGRAAQWWQQWMQRPATTPISHHQQATPLHFSSLSRDHYIATVEALRRHIGRGDCYEINFCQRFEAKAPQLDALSVFRRLRAASPNPFAGYYKMGSSHLMCASPERFLYRQHLQLISQPMKGTAPRHLDNEAADRETAKQLQQNTKERSENIMVVDLVRNDLSRICLPGTVRVEELCGVYPFPQVHQMISTVSGTLPPHTPLAAILAATFPMGSMTGAPKARVLQLIARYESHERGLFSGSIGYIDPAGNFDFNVVIRSILYNAHNHNLQYWAGSGITWHSQPAAEYEECMLKAAAIRGVLQQ